MSHASEPCTLIYHLNEGAPITPEQFLLIVKSLHSYKVEKVKLDECSRSVTVKLNYNASMKNVRAKLGNVPATIIKQNPLIKPAELNELESLRASFGFGGPIDEEEYETPGPNKKRRH